MKGLEGKAHRRKEHRVKESQRESRQTGIRLDEGSNIRAWWVGGEGGICHEKIRMFEDPVAGVNWGNNVLNVWRSQRTGL